MTVLDELRALEQRVVARLEELRPLVEEYRELEQLAERFGLDTASAPPKAQRPAPRRRQSTASRSRRAPGGTQALGRKRRETIVALVEQRPGITVPELGSELGVDPTSLYRVVRRLEAEGSVTKEGQNLRPA